MRADNTLILLAVYFFAAAFSALHRLFCAAAIRANPALVNFGLRRTGSGAVPSMAVSALMARLSFSSSRSA